MHEAEIQLEHARRLQASGLLSQKEFEKVEKNLNKFIEKVEDSFATMYNPLYDNVADFVERQTSRSIGPLWKKLKFAQSTDVSSNEFEETTVAFNILDVMGRILCLKSSFINKAQEVGMNFMPEYSHMQRSRPTLIAHHLLSYYDMFSRDFERFEFLYRTFNSTLSNVRSCFEESFYLENFKDNNALETNNSLDFLSNHDFLLSYLSFGAILATNLSRLAEEMVLWSSTEFNYISFPDNLTTTSSMMPQKKNPDGAELLRGKSARVIGNLVSCLTTVKGLPLGNNQDKFENINTICDTSTALKQMLNLAQVLVEFQVFNYKTMEKNAQDPALSGPILVKRLIEKGIDPQQAFTQVRKLIKYVKKKNQDLKSLDINVLHDFFPDSDQDLLKDVNAFEQIKALDLIPGESGPEKMRETLKNVTASLEEELMKWFGISMYKNGILYSKEHFEHMLKNFE
jgi:argininosuccinate lyase